MQNQNRVFPGFPPVNYTFTRLFQAKADDQRYVPTQLGVATLSSALSPGEALVVFAEVQKARKCFVLESELHIIYQVSE